MEIEAKEFGDLLVKDIEGIVFLSTGGDLNEWLDGITEILFTNKAINSGNPDVVFKAVYKLTSTGNRTDLAMIFKDDYRMINMGKLAMLRLQLHDTFPNAWVSDFIIIYEDHYKK